MTAYNMNNLLDLSRRALLGTAASLAVAATALLTSPAAHATGCATQFGPLKVSVVPSKSTVSPGETIVYTICVSNSGPVQINFFAIGSDINGDGIDDFYYPFSSILPGQTLCVQQPYTINLTSGCVTNLVGSIGGSPNASCTLASTVVCVASGGCTYTLGYWKNHSNVWPVSSLTFGGKTYSKSDLLYILNLPPKGDASIILAHQLIAALLNYANNAQPSAQADAAIAAANSLLSTVAKVPANINSGTALGTSLTSQSSVLDAFNNGLFTSHCN